MLDFKLFQIPVRVEPWFWITGFFLGGGLQAEMNRQGLLAIALWIIVLFVSILVHEFGHALTSRKLTGVNPSVKLWAMGGLAYPNTHLSRKESFWVTSAGPLAGLAFFGLILLGTCLAYGFEAGPGIIGYLAYRSPQFLNIESVLAFQNMNWSIYTLLRALVFINLWWSLLNLLPVFPLDGGQIFASISKSDRLVFQVGLVTGILAAVVFFNSGRLFGALLFGFLAYQNFQRLKGTSHNL